MITNATVTEANIPIGPYPYYQWQGYPVVQQTPHKCPVCEGRRLVEEGFYPDDPHSTTCKSCWGLGVLWR